MAKDKVRPPGLRAGAYATRRRVREGNPELYDVLRPTLDLMCRLAVEIQGLDAESAGYDKLVHQYRMAAAKAAELELRFGDSGVDAAAELAAFIRGEK